MRIRKKIYILCIFQATTVILFWIVWKGYITKRQSESINSIRIAKAIDESKITTQLALKKATRDTEYNEDAENSTQLKYILLWTSPKTNSFIFLKRERQPSIDYTKCPYTNCFVTNDIKYLGGDVTKFDVIAFASPEVVFMPFKKLPRKRSPHQKYAFASIESSDYYPVCSKRFDGFFNWTWTFKLDSDIKWSYMIIRDKDSKIVGPQKNMNWIKFKGMDPVSHEIKKQLSSKRKAAAWFVSNCSPMNNRKSIVTNLQKQLLKYNLTVDIYGSCGPLKCPPILESACLDLIKYEYYFYLSFENSFSEDYVTEKLLHAVQNDAVPIVYGAANYSRFLPEHSYLNAMKLSPRNLAAKMYQLIEHPDDYYDYFRWKKYYSYHKPMDNVETDKYCQICTLVNNERLVKERKAYQHFREWWDPPARCGSE